MDSDTGVVLSVFQTPFYGCFQILKETHSVEW